MDEEGLTKQIFKEIKQLVKIRYLARVNKDFEVADLLRDFVKDAYGMIIIDTQNGYTLKIEKNENKNNH